MKFDGFIGGAYQSTSLPISAQRCINWYPEFQDDKNASTLDALRPTPGYQELIEFNDPSLPQGSFTRAIYRTSRGIGSKPETNGSVIIVVGPNVYWFKSDNSYELLGVISNLISKVDIIDDGYGMVIADGSGLYRLELSTKIFTKVAFDLIDPTHVAFMEGFTFAIGQKKNLPQNTFFFSRNYNNEEWDALDYYNAESKADPITAIISIGTYVHAFGPNSSEAWSSTGDADNPLQRAYASSGDIGIHAPQSLCKIGSNAFLIGSKNQGSASAYMSRGSELVRISTLALDQEWFKFDTTDCTTWTYSQNGHDFVMFNFDAMDKTYVYDVSQNRWHERASRDDLTDTLHRWDLNYGVQVSDRAIVGDRFSTKLFLMSNDYTTENGKNILRIRTTAYQNSEQKMVRIDSVRFDIETGNGITNEDPERYTQAPQVMWKDSRDRAHTYSSVQKRSLGATGEYRKTVEFMRRGMCRNYNGEFSISDSCNTSVLNGFIFPVISQRSRQS